jgi:hypothetical protein
LVPFSFVFKIRRRPLDVGVAVGENLPFSYLPLPGERRVRVGTMHKVNDDDPPLAARLSL